MFKLQLFRTEPGKEKIHIFYHEMTPLVKEVIRLVEQDKPVIKGVCEEENLILELDRILYFETVDRHTFAYTKDQVCRVGSTLSALEEDLEAYGFVRINKSSLVNVYRIDRIKPQPNMRIHALLDNGEKLQISRNYKRSFEDYLRRVRSILS